MVAKEPNSAKISKKWKTRVGRSQMRSFMMRAEQSNGMGLGAIQSLVEQGQKGGWSINNPILELKHEKVVKSS